MVVKLPPVSTTMCPSRVVEVAHDLAAVIDPIGFGERRPGDVDGGEDAARIHEAMCPSGVAEDPHDLAAIVNSVGRSFEGSLHSDEGETAPGIHEAT